MSSKNPLLKVIKRVIVTWVALSASLFLAAGRLNWPIAWLYVILWFVPGFTVMLILSRQNPDLLAERAMRHRDAQVWEKHIYQAYTLTTFSTIVVAGLDAGRFQWSVAMPLGFQITGIVLYLAMHGLAGWAMLTNTYHSTASRIQSDRSQKVVTSGPYRYLRHPTYLATAIAWISMPFFLGSWWALIPSGFASLVMIVRTALEDHLLQKRLPGYAEYARRVRYRLLPGIW